MTPSLLMFMHDFASAERYTKHHLCYLLWGQERGMTEQTMVGTAIRYCAYLYHDKMMAPTTIRGHFTALKTFWLYTGRGNLSALAPLIESNLGKWDKKHKLKQAKAFTKEMFGKISQLLYITLHYIAD